MLVVTNCAKNYATPIYQSLLQNAGDATRHNSLTPLLYFTTYTINPIYALPCSG